MKYQFIWRHRYDHRVKKMCQVLKVSRSSYYQWIMRIPSARAAETKRLLREIKEIHTASQMESYGSPRMARELQDRGFRCSTARVARLMRKHHIRAKIKRRFKGTTNSNHDKEISPNLLEQDFTVLAPHEVWVSDITYIRTREGWLYLTMVMDLFDRQIVGW
jgi:putative transposase